MTTLSRFMAFQTHPASWQRPAGNADYRITNPFGGVDLVNAGQSHQGIDIGNFRTGDPVYAPVSCLARGVIHTDGAVGLIFDLGGDWQLELWHLSRTLISKSVPVEQGQRLGFTGASGNVSGAHTHIELKRAGKAVDPFIFIPIAGRETLPIPGATAGSRYVDVPEGHRSHDAILWATDKGFFPRSQGQYFRPSQAMTREDVAVVIRRLHADLKR